MLILLFRSDPIDHPSLPLAQSYYKIYPLPTLLDLYHIHGVSLRGIHLTMEVMYEEARVLRSRPHGQGSSSAWWGIYSTIERTKSKRGYWGRSADDLLVETGGAIPPLLEELRRVILSECRATEGVFRRSSNVSSPTSKPGRRLILNTG